jgi:opacity protein-like surface antigen
MRQLVLSALALVPLWSAAQTPGDPAAAAPSATPASASQPSGPQPIAIEPAAGPSSPLPIAAAPGATDRSYLFARLGTIVPRSSDLSGFENGIAVEAGAGTRLTRYLAVEVGTGYLRTSQVEKGTNDTVGSYHVKQDMSAVPLVATVRVSTHTRGFEAYALAGGGLYLWALGGTVSSSQYAPYSFSDTSTQLGAHVGAGLSASLSSRFTLGLEAKYLLARATLFGHTSDLGSAIVTAAFGYAF